MLYLLSYCLIGRSRQDSNLRPRDLESKDLHWSLLDQNGIAEAIGWKEGIREETDEIGQEVCNLLR